MKHVYYLLIFFLPLCFFAQNVGINASGAAPNASAMLDVNANNKGVLIPNVALTSATDATTIPSPATSLLVYNTGTGGLSPAGYYTWSGTAWLKFSTATKSKYTVPMWPIGYTATTTSANKAVFWNQWGTTNAGTFFNTDPATPSNVALGVTWLSQGWNVITTNGQFEGATGWMYSATANVSCTVFIYKYTPVAGSNAMVTPILLGSASTGTMNTANTVYNWTVTGGGAVSKGDIIWVFYKFSNAGSYYGYGSLEFSYSLQ